MKTLFDHRIPFVRSISSALFALSFLTAGIAGADTRQDAISAISELRAAGVDKKLPDEMKSLNEAFAKAEQYHQVNDSDNSEQYYRMTIQKARVLATGAAEAPVPPAVQAKEKPPEAAPQQPEPSPVAVTPPAISDQSPEPVAKKADETLETDTYAPEIISDKLVGAASSYTIVKGDTLRLVAAKLGVSRQHLTRMNKLDAKSALQVGGQLKYNNRKIIPLKMLEGIVVNIPDRTLYFFQQGKLVRSLPVALGTATKNEKYVWQTPTGKFKIVAKQKDPTWYVPPSIQAEMEEEGKEVITSIPPGPDNPLGKYAIKTSIPGILIHSTTKPWSIYSFASHGCIRVYPALMEEFFKEVKVNTPGEIIYRPVKLAVTDEGRVFLEVHHDVYSKSAGLAAEAKKLIEKNQLADRIDWKKFDSVVKQKLGIAEDISL